MFINRPIVDHIGTLQIQNFKIIKYVQIELIFLLRKSYLLLQRRLEILRGVFSRFKV